MKILLVDDDLSILDALSVGIKLHWRDSSVVEASDGEEAIQAFYEHNPDVVVLDVSLPGKNGFEVLQEIRRVSDAPVLMLTARGDETDQVRGLELGADDYVVKPFGQLALLARIKAVLRRAELPAPIETRPDFVAGDLAINFATHQVTRKGEPVSLTPVEYKLLYHLARNAGHLMPHQALLDRVWGDEYGATTDHLKVFVSRLRAKIERDGGPRRIETERGLGYRLVRAGPDHAPPPSAQLAEPPRHGPAAESASSPGPHRRDQPRLTGGGPRADLRLDPDVGRADDQDRDRALA